MKIFDSILLIAILLLTGCGGGQDPEKQETLTVFAAASLGDAFTELAKAFEAAAPGATVVLNFAGSSQLAAQLREGAAADVFAPANPAQMAAVISAGRITVGTEQLFATNRLTVIVPVDNPAGIGRFEDLAGPDVALVLAVEGVPVRDYTDTLAAGLPPAVRVQFYANVVSEEGNVRQVAAKIALGEADAGVVYASDVTPDLAGRVRQIAIPAAQNVLAAYPIAPLADAPAPALARAFIDFVLSAEGQGILARWGFGPAAAGE